MTPAPSPEPAGVQIDGPAVRRLRKMAGQTIAGIAKPARISVQYLSQIERGDKTSVSPPAFARICDALGVDPQHRHLLIRDEPVGRSA